MRNPTLFTGYCLRGEVGGIERSFPLLSGDNRVGSLESNEVFLPRRGVSREHAILRIDGDRLLIQDRASKNGTFINGRRASSGQVALGEVVRFGPIRLRFESYHQDDAELAISLDPAIADQTSVIPVVEASLSSAGLGGELARQWLRLAEAFHAHLHGKIGGDLGASIRLLVEEFHLQGAALLEIAEDGDPIVLAASGRLDHSATSHLQQLYSRLPSSDRPDINFHRSSDKNEPFTTFSVLQAIDQDPLVLALWGGFPGRARSELLLRLLIRMVEPFRPRPATPTPRQEPTGYPGLIVPPDYVHAQSEAMGKIYSLMQNLAQGDLPILIIGETGVGKEYLAQILHQSSPRRQGPFLAINCAAIPAELLESELFGIGEGVATGVAAKKGRLQMAQGGTMFLDEIGDMSSDLQAKLLRALQEKEVHPVGQDPVAIDVRILAATNQQLSQRIEEGSFRADLYYRLAGYVLEIPAIKERPEDIPALVEHFLRNCAQQLGRPIRGMTVRALRMLTEYPWPGNVRELSNEVRRAVYLCPENGNVESATLSKAIREYYLHQEMEAGEGENSATPEGQPGDQEFPAPVALGLDSLNLEQLENQAVEEALRRCQNNQVQAAKLLGISRQSLRRRMERLGLLKSPRPG
jgi:DNA-binding NtrC family response regulator